MNRLGVVIPKRAVLAYFIGLMLLAAGAAILFAVYIELRPVFAPFMESGHRRGVIVSMPFIAGFWAVVFVVTRYVTPTLLKWLGAPNIDYIGLRRMSGKERIVPDYPVRLRKAARDEVGDA